MINRKEPLFSLVSCVVRVCLQRTSEDTATVEDDVVVMTGNMWIKG
jgi:hypothetical protein